MFRTELTIAPATGQLTRTARVLTVGSCFADSIGARLATNRVETLVNPFGTVFQPLALTRLLRAAAGEEVDWQQHLVEARGRWQSYDLHGSIGADSPVELLQHIQELVRSTGEFLRTADVLLLTLGTAWAYRLRETGELVNNCHKQSADLFVRELLTPDEVINALAETHAYLRRINPELRFVLTVSPVRHLKDTLQLNSVSKSVLRLATHIVSDLLPGVAYFPAYELLVDDLRDYRFYAADMLHPSAVAEDYVWDKFARAYFDADFGRFRKEWAAVQQSLGHRPLHAGAPEHRQFLESTREKLEQLSLRKVEVGAELAQVRMQLAALPELRQTAPVVEIEDGEERIDIGEGTEMPVIDAEAAPETVDRPNIESADGVGGRPSRLSPEEFRAQRATRSGRPERGRRDGRGKGQSSQPSENEQFQGQAPFSDVSPTISTSEKLSLEPASEADVPVANQPTDEAAEGAAVPLDDALAGQEPGKKKKRRSRGGAKRTARKHAQRLAEGLTDGEQPLEADLGSNAGAVETAGSRQPTAEQSEGLQEGRNARVTANPERGQRNDRRRNGGRAPREPLFAAPSPSEAGETEAQPKPTAATMIPNATDNPIIDAETPGSATPGSKSRNSRNRKKKKEAAGGASLSAPAEDVSSITGDQNQAKTGETEPADFRLPVVEGASRAARNVPTQQALPVAALPVTSLAAAATATVSAGGAAAPAAPKRDSRLKARAASGARTEKPAFDTPIIPVVDASQVRTQVAAGRMSGTDASLIAQAAPQSAGPAKAVPGKTTKVKTVAAKAKTVGQKPTPAALVPVAKEAKPAPPTAKKKGGPAAKDASATVAATTAQPANVPVDEPATGQTAAASKAKAVRPKAAPSSPTPAAKAKPAASKKPAAKQAAAAQALPAAPVAPAKAGKAKAKPVAKPKVPPVKPAPTKVPATKAELAATPKAIKKPGKPA